MSKARGITILVCVAIGAIVSIFTVSKGDVAKWNDKIVGMSPRFGAAWTMFEPNIRPWLDGKAFDPEKTDAAFKGYEHSVGQTAAEIRRETPPDAPECKEFHQALVAFADLQEAQLGDLRKILAEMKASNPPKEADIQRVGDKLDALGKKEEEANAVIKGRQQIMASKFRLKLQ
jgi:hypothetical protein